MDRIKLGAVALTVALVAAGCLAGATPSPSPTPVPTPTASPRLTPTPTPVDVAKQFLATLSQKDFASRLSVSGSLTVGTLTFPVGGQGALAGSDSDSTLTIVLPAGEQTMQTISVGNEKFERRNGGPWLRQPQPTGGGGETLGSVLRAIETVEDVGIVSRDGRELHRLKPAATAVIEPAAFGLTDPAMKDASVTIEFFAEEDGTPAAMVVAAEWTLVSGDQQVEAAMSLDFRFEYIGPAVKIERPTDIWQTYTSERFGYTVAHPEAWEVDVTGEFDQFRGPELAFVVAGRQGSGGGDAQPVRHCHHPQQRGDARVAREERRGDAGRCAGPPAHLPREPAGG